jgi:hypothetical protein
MQLDLQRLSQIFVAHPSEYYNKKKEGRESQPTASSYVELQRCRAWDTEGWQELARLTGKTIHFVHCHGDPIGKEKAVYYPDGSFR